MNKKVFFLFIIYTLVECARIESRQNVGLKKESRSKFRTRARPISETLEALLNVYDPSFLAVVWPKITNGVHLFVDGKCWDDISVFFRDLSDGRAWAYRAVDASGRYQSGLFRGNTFWLGSKKQCLQLDYSFLSGDGNETFDEFQNGDYLNAVTRRENYFDAGTDEWRALLARDELMRRSVAANIAPPHRLAYSAVQLLLNLTKITMTESYDIMLGVCLPRSCSPEDVASIIKFSIMINDNLKSNKTIPRIVKITSLRQINGKYNIKSDVKAIMLICVTLFIFTVAVIATLTDLKLIKWRRHNSKSMSFNLQKFHNNNLEAENRTIKEENTNHACEVQTRKDSNLVDMETLTINNINDSNINLVTVNKVIKPNALPPSITLDVVSMERVTGSCKRCGKYRKQCYNINPKPKENMPACPRVKSFASLTAEYDRENKFFKNLLQCFALNYSWRRIFNTNMTNKDLSVIHGLRVISTFWIIFVHVAMIVNYVSEDAGDINEYNNAYYILTTGTLAFDTLFFVSGLFSSHHFFFLKRQYTVEELVSFGGTCGQILQFVCFVTNRAIRLLPSYAYAIFLTAVLARVSRDTSPLILPEGDSYNCDVYWWRNLLYITTIFPRDEQCMQVSWYMSVETQLHVFGALACAVVATGRRVVAALAALLVLVATAADVSAAYSEYGQHVANVFAAYATVIERPLARAAPYFIGVYAGWLVHRMDGAMYISKLRTFCLWIASLFILLASMLLPWLGHVWISAWLHLVWPIALLWPALVFSTNLAAVMRRLLDSRCVSALSRLSCSMLLLHGALARSLLLSADCALCAQSVCLWFYFAGIYILTVLAALLLSLLVETPCCSLLRRLSDYAS